MQQKEKSLFRKVSSSPAFIIYAFAITSRDGAIGHSVIDYVTP